MNVPILPDKQIQMATTTPQVGELHAGAVVELSPCPSGTKHLGKTTRSAQRARMLTSRQEEILLAVHRYRYMRSADVTRLYFSPASSNHVGALLRELCDARFLYRFLMPHTRVGATEYVYTLGSRGRSHLRELGIDVSWYFRPADTARLTYLHLLHALTLTKVLIATEDFVRERDDIELKELRTEYELNSVVPKVAASSDSPIRVVPDAWLDFYLVGQAHPWRPVLLEIDRATEEQKHFKRKLESLIAFVSPGGGYKACFGTSAVTIALATTGSPARVQSLLTWTQDVLSATHKTAYADLFRVCGLSSELDENSLLQAPIWRRPFEKTPMTLLD